MGISHSLQSNYQIHTFQLVYGQEAIILVELELPSLRIAIKEWLNDGVRNQTYLNMATIQKWCKTYYDSKMNTKILAANDLVLLI